MFLGICYCQSVLLVTYQVLKAAYKVRLKLCVAAYPNISADLTAVPITWYICANSHLQHFGISQQTVKNGGVQNGFSSCSSAEISSSIGMSEKRYTTN